MGDNGQATGTIERVPPGTLRPSALNSELYHQFDPSNEDDAALVRSIVAEGVKEPLHVDSDGVILSGHRRHAAATYAGLPRVPVLRHHDEHLATMPEGEQLRLLASYNRQRQKDAGELAAEEIVLAQPADVFAAMRERLEEKRLEHLADAPASMAIVGTMERKEITDAKKPMLDAILAVVEQRRKYWPLSVRQIHYALLNDPPLIHAGKARLYANDKASYKGLCDLCTRARLAGSLPWASLTDETRPVELWDTHPTVAGYVESQMYYFLGLYRRDLMQSQPYHVEIVCEKNTVAEIVRRVAGDYTIPVTSGRGYCSVEPRRQMAERYLRSGKGGLVLLLVSDADPDGEEIAQSMARSLRDDFNITKTNAIRAALTPMQAAELGLPPSMDAKKTSANYRKFFEKYRTKNAYELEALPPEKLAEIVRDTIEGLIDRDAYDMELGKWQEDAFELEKLKARVKSVVSRTWGSDHGTP